MKVICNGAGKSEYCDCGACIHSEPHEREQSTCHYGVFCTHWRACGQGDDKQIQVRCTTVWKQEGV